MGRNIKTLFPNTLINTLLQDADLVLTGLTAQSFNFKTIDYSTPFAQTPLNFLIPYPTSTENLAAIVKPFDFKVKQKHLGLNLLISLNKIVFSVL